MASPGLLTGIAELARFRATGFAHFGDTPQALLNSLAPLLAFPLVGGVLQLLGGQPHMAATELLISTVALLTPPVLSHAIAGLMGRDPLWLRYAVAVNWCQSAVTLFTLLAGTAAAVIGAGVGLPASSLARLAVALVLLYWLVLNWFLGWRGLRLSVGRAVVFIVLLNMGTGLVVIAPLLATEMLQ